MYIFFSTNRLIKNDMSILNYKMYGVQFNLNMGKISSKDFGLVAAKVIIEAYSRMRNGYALHPLYTHT